MAIRTIVLKNHYFDEMYAKANANNIKIVPKTTVTRIKNASKPRAFCFPNNCSAPPVKELAAFVLEGCIATTIINNTHTTTISDKIKLYKGFPPQLKFFSILTQKSR